MWYRFTTWCRHPKLRNFFVKLRKWITHRLVPCIKGPSLHLPVIAHWAPGELGIDPGCEATQQQPAIYFPKWPSRLSETKFGGPLVVCEKDNKCGLNSRGLPTQAPHRSNDTRFTKRLLVYPAFDELLAEQKRTEKGHNRVLRKN